jgi:peptidoglycan/LPS O-acetylase OafA/YrhL
MDWLKGNKFLIAFLIIGTVFIWLVVDAWVGSNGGPTESQVIAYWGRHLTFWSFLIGALCGHWFFGRRSADYALWFWPFIAIGLLLAWDIWFIRTHGWIEVGYRSPWICFAVGLPAGSLFWPQRDPESIVP